MFFKESRSTMKKYAALLTPLAALTFNLYASSALAFNPDEYNYRDQSVLIDGQEMAKLRIYNAGQEVIFSKEDLNIDEEEKMKTNRVFNDTDMENVQNAMQYVKDVFGVPDQAPTIEIITNDEDGAAFISPTNATDGLTASRLSTWFIGTSKSTNLPTGVLEIGDMGNKEDKALHSLVDKGEGASMASVIVHEMMHGMGISAIVDNDGDDAENVIFFAANPNHIFSGHLYDVYDHQLHPEMVFKKVSTDDYPDPSADPDIFYQIDNQANSGAFFIGDNVTEVLTVQGKKAKISFPDDDLEGFKDVGIPVNGYERTYDEEEEKYFDVPEMSHLELQNSMMSHQNYRNWGTFMEAELAVLQDIGFTNIDRRKFFGFSVYNDGLTYNNYNGFDSTQDWGIGLHVYGSKNTISQQRDIKTQGKYAYGIRIEGHDNTLIIPEDTAIKANGKENAGILVSYGKNHVLNIQGKVEARGTNSYALRFDFGGNILGDQSEYRGSYFQIEKDNETAQWKNSSDAGTVSAINGPLATQVDISGTLTGQAAAIYISDNALVRQINILDGAVINGDIISEWSSTENRYGTYGNGITLFKPEAEVDRTLLVFGSAADEDGQATDEADPDFEMTYAGDITGADGFDVQLLGGELTYGGTADINILQTEEDTELTLADGDITVTTVAGDGRISMDGNSNIIVKGEAQFNDLNIKEGAEAKVDAGQGKVEINDMENAGEVKFTSDKVQKEQITVDTYTGTDDSVLSLELDSDAANQLSGGSTAEAVQQGAEILAIDNNTTSSALNLHIAEGDINGAIDAVVGADGKILSASEKKNATAKVLQSLGANSFLVFRAQMNDLEKRMGDLRNMPSERGAWAKVIAGQSKYKGIHNDYETFQFGIDQRFDDFFAGVMASYTDGDGKLKHGSTDDKNYSFGLYGGWLGKDGQFVDITLKRHHLDSDYHFSANNKYSKGSFETSGTSASAEYGWRLGIENTNYYVEPQTEFLYGYLNDTRYAAGNGVSVKQSAIKSAIGRLGVALGWLSPAKKGNVYIKASVLNDWEGDAKVCMRKGNTSRCYSEDMGGTWGEFALGGTWHITDSLSTYGEMETTTGSPVRTVYEFNAGLRLNF